MSLYLKYDAQLFVVNVCIRYTKLYLCGKMHVLYDNIECRLTFIVITMNMSVQISAREFWSTTVNMQC